MPALSSRLLLLATSLMTRSRPVIYYERQGRARTQSTAAPPENKTKQWRIFRVRGFVSERTTRKQTIPVLVLQIPATTERIPEEPLERFQSKQHNCDVRPRG